MRPILSLSQLLTIAERSSLHPHKFVYSYLTGVPYEEVTPEHYAGVKRLLHEFLYGMTTITDPDLILGSKELAKKLCKWFEKESWTEIEKETNIVYIDGYPYDMRELAMDLLTGD